MATSLTFYKLVGDISAGSSFVVNKLASGNTASAIVVFNKLPRTSVVNSYIPKIGSVKVGGQNILTEEIEIKYEFGLFEESDSSFSSFLVGVYQTDTVSEKDNTTTSSVTQTFSNVALGSEDYPAYRITVKSTNSSRGAEVVMSDFQLQIDSTDLLYTISAKVSPEGAGTVEGVGSYVEFSTPTLTAKANTGYKFVKWQDGNTDNPRKIIVTGSALYTAYFEVNKINKIYVGTSQLKAIYIGTQEVKAIYIGTTKVYG